jgi:small conductance mechanosensitive channel
LSLSTGSEGLMKMNWLERTLDMRRAPAQIAINVLVYAVLVCAHVAQAQTSNHAATPPAKTPAKGAETPGAAQEKVNAAVATTAGPITVHRQVSDQEIQRFLAKFLPRYPGVRSMKVTVEDGVVAIEGRVDDDSSRDEITDVVRRVEGVRLVLNQLNTDEEVMTGWQFAGRELGALRDYLARKWFLILLALSTATISCLLARLFAARSEDLLAPLVHNVLLRSVVGSVISAMLVIGGLMLALGILQLSQAVMSVVGVSGLVVLAVGFAFRDITENFIASVLLGIRRPFQVGDYITIAGQSGVVKSLNTRATVLVTLEGKHVRIPNSTIFKEIMVNATASPNMRNSFDVLIPNEASTANAISALNHALRDQPGVLSDPPPRVLVEALEPGGVRLRADFWSPAHNIDELQLMSDIKFRAKVALQQSGVMGVSANVVDGQTTSQIVDRTGAPVPPTITVAAEQAAANVRRDVQAAVAAQPAVNNGREIPAQRVLQEPESRVSDEGKNLLKEIPAE